MMVVIKAIVGGAVMFGVFMFVMGVVSIADGQPDTDCARFVAWVCGK